MYRNLLTKKFFQDNPYSENSAQRFVYSTLLYDGLDKAAAEFTLNRMPLSSERLKLVAEEKEMIMSEQDPKVIFQLLRKELDGLNRPILIDKALEFEDEVIPLVIEKLVRSDHDTFIDNAAKLLAKSRKNYSPYLLERYAQFRSPYVRSILCLILGFRGDKDIIPWMMERFFEMKKHYPGETYDQGPLLALHELNIRFYSA
jgi:hypothetical protein